MRAILVLAILVISTAAEAGRQLGSQEQKMEFAKDAITSVIEAYDMPQKYKLDEKSLEFDKCNDYGKYINEPVMADPYDCSIVYFYLRDKQGSLYAGKMVVDVELKKHFRFGIIPVKSKLPQFDITTREYTDEKSKEQIYMGLASANQKDQDKQSFEELFSLEKSVPVNLSSRDKAPLTPVRKGKK